MADDFDRGRQVGKYEILTRLSVGGMAELYLAFLPGPGGFKKFVALKQILPDARNDEQFVKMFLDEARITASLNHPHIGQVFDLGRDEKSGELFLAMEFIAGQDLNSVIRTAIKGGALLPLPLTCLIVHDLCLGLHAAHTFVDPSGQALPIIHRDVSPKNVMVSYAGHVKVIDFGIAKAKGRLIRTQTGQVRGTQSYMSPEQIQDLPMDGRSDLFSVGIVLHEMLTGERLYPASSPASILKVIQQAPVDPCEKNREVPRALGEVVLRALAKEPEDRFQTGKALARAIEAAGPQLADEDALAAFMSQMFEAQLKSSRALFEAAQRGAETSQLTGLVRRLTINEVPAASLATPIQRPAVLRTAATRPQQVAVPEAVAGGGPKPWVLAAAIGGALIAIAALIWNGLPVAEPAPSTGPPPATRISTGPLAPLQQGLNALTAKDYPAASEAFDKVLALEADNWTALHGAGVAERHLRRHPQARQHLERALQLAKTPLDASIVSFDLACVLAQLGELEAALTQLERADAWVGKASFSKGLATEPDLEPLRQLPAFVLLRDGPPPRPPVTLSAATQAAIKEARAEIEVMNYERAALRLERCIKQQPDAYPCYRMLGSTYASMANRDQSAGDMELAKKAYVRFLEVAPFDDEYVPRVKAILLSSPP